MVFCPARVCVWGAVGKCGLLIRLAPLDELLVCIVLPVGLALAINLAADGVANGVIAVVFFCLCQTSTGGDVGEPPNTLPMIRLACLLFFKET